MRIFGEKVITKLRCPPLLKWGCQSEEGGSLNLPPPARFVEMLTNEIIFSNEKIIRIYGILNNKILCEVLWKKIL